MKSSLRLTTAVTVSCPTPTTTQILSSACTSLLWISRAFRKSVLLGRGPVRGHSAGLNRSAQPLQSADGSMWYRLGKLLKILPASDSGEPVLTRLEILRTTAYVPRSACKGAKDPKLGVPSRTSRSTLLMPG